MFTNIHIAQQSSTPCPLIRDLEVETVIEYKYLGAIIDSKRSFESNMGAVCENMQQRLLFFIYLKFTV